MSQGTWRSCAPLTKQWRDDRDALDAIVTEHLAPDFEFEALLTGLTYKGAAGARGTGGRHPGHRRLHTEILEAVDLDEHVLVVVRMAGRGSRSGVPVSQQGAVLLTFKADKIASAKSFSSKAEALGAVGLRE